MDEIIVTETTVWHQGKSRTFKDEAEALEWVEEIEAARERKRLAKEERDSDDR